MTDQDDPFAGIEGKTIIKPSGGRAAPPGGGSGGSGSGGSGRPPGGPAGDGAAPAGSGAGGGREVPLAIDALMGVSINPLVGAAAPLLIAAPRIRTTARHPNPAGLKQALAEGIAKFEARARELSLPNEQVVAARYILCTLLDEAAGSTPWGASGAWATQSLLVQFHNEAWGGEKVFALMSKLAENVDANRNLLELLYVALAFGFEGRFRVLDNGRAQVDALRTRLFDLLKAKRVATESALSPRWEGVSSGGTRLRAAVPVWLIACGVATVLALVGIGLRLHLGSVADPTFTALSSLDAKAATVSQPPPPPAPQPRLAGFLKPEIDAGLVSVQDYADRSVVTIKGDGFFEPGSAVIAPAVSSLLPRIAQALNDTPGRILINGHTDNQPIHTARFPSNWHLSQERADAVRTTLAQTVKPERMRAEGRADGDPVADNATPAGRARNRRVVITLFVQHS